MSSRTIEQSVEFEGTTADELCETYLDSDKHGAAIGAPVSIHPVVGGEFRAFDGRLQGRLLEIVPGQRIVQSWRGAPWKEGDLDSILVLRFADTPGGARIDLVHSNIPEHVAGQITGDAWNDRYWRSWRRYLDENRSKVDSKRQKQ